MGIDISPKVSSNGLVFNYDTQNPKSYIGPPLRNHIQTISPNVTSGTGYVLTGGSEVVDIPTLGPTTVAFTNLQNTGASWCCVNWMNYGDTGNILSGSTLYTYLILYRTDSGYTHPNWMYRYENTSAGTYITEAGVHDTSKRIYLGNGWYYAWNTFTTQPTTARMTCFSFSYNYSSFNDKLSVGNVAILQGDYSGLHPRYWPAVNTTRTNTQVLVDTVRNNTITANSLTYASNGSFSFNGSSDYMEVSNADNYWNSNVFGTATNFTIECWYKPNLFKDWDTMIMKQNASLGGWYSSPQGASIWTNVNGFQGVFASGVASNPAGSVVVVSYTTTTLKWYHVCFTGDGTTLRLYVDGIERGTGAIADRTVPVTTTSDGPSFGKRAFMNGSMENVKMYTRALTSQEVLQNFNAGRGRFGI